MNRNTPRLLSLLFVANLHCLGLAEDHWPQFRGPGARGVVENEKLPDTWSATENVAWKAEVPGLGWSSPIVWGDKVFVTTVINSGSTDEPTKGLYFGGNRSTPPDTDHQWKVLCLDLHSGKLLWEKQVHEGKPAGTVHLKNTYASETPVTDGQRVYCYFGNLGVFCLDFDGNLVWKKDIEAKRTQFGWGTAASPALYEDRLYLVNDNEEDSYLLALNKLTGEEIWRVPREEKSNWSTPFIWRNEKRTEIVTPGSGRVRSYDLDGNELWSLSGMSNITIATPYEHDGLLYVTSGYVLSLSRPIYAIRPGAAGDISLEPEESASEFVAWRQKKSAPYNPSTITYQDKLYVLYDQGKFGCFDAADGTEIYEPQRLRNGKAFTSSPWAYNGKIFCLNEDGVTFVIKAGDEFELLHTNVLAEDDMGMATPAIAGDSLLIRTAKRLYCLRQGASLPAASEDVKQTGEGGTTPKDQAVPKSENQGQEQEKSSAGPSAPRTLELAVDGLSRTALIFPPSQESSAAPVVFAFHGHGGTSRSAARSFHFQDAWPEALVVYMQGVPTPGRLTDPQGKRNGWQHDVGDHDDRDVKFFDATLESLRKQFKVDNDRIYATGHSNGAAFTYVLWAARSDVLAAVAPSAGGSRSLRSLKPKPALHVAGRNDPLVRFAGQERVIAAVRTINGCEEDGREWAKDCVLYESAGGTPLVTFIHDGDHKFPAAAPDLIVKFFQKHARNGNESAR